MNWKLGRVIGEGAYGKVHIARGAHGERVAVKVCRGEDKDRLERENRGVMLYRKIAPGEGLVRVLDFGESEDGFWYAMELADDEFNGRDFDEAGYRPRTLASVLDGEKALPMERCLSLAYALAAGLATLQKHHLLHRDIKPGNVLFVNGKPVLSDPGLLIEEADSKSLVGTPGYVPPESFVSGGGDVYSLGLTLKAASFGRSVDSLEMGPALEADVASPYFTRWWQILNRATEKDERRRYQSAAAFIKDIKKLQLRQKLFGGSLFKIGGIIILAIMIACALALGIASSFNKPKDVREIIKEHAEIYRKWATGNTWCIVERVSLDTLDSTLDGCGSCLPAEKLSEYRSEIKRLKDDFQKAADQFESIRKSAPHVEVYDWTDEIKAANEKAWKAAQPSYNRINEIKARSKAISNELKAALNEYKQKRDKMKDAKK